MDPRHPVSVNNSSLNCAPSSSSSSMKPVNPVRLPPMIRLPLKILPMKMLKIVPKIPPKSNGAVPTNSNEKIKSTIPDTKVKNPQNHMPTKNSPDSKLQRSGVNKTSGSGEQRNPKKAQDK